MDIEKLIKHMRKEAQDYRTGRTLGRAFADAEDVLDEAATTIEQLQAENGRLKRERDLAVELLQGQCEACAQYYDCDPEDEPCNSCVYITFSGGEDHWKWRKTEEE